MYLISKPFTRRELYDLLCQAAIDALCAERPELRRLENQIVHAEIVLPQTGPWKGGAVIEFTIKEATHKDLPGQKTIFDDIASNHDADPINPALASELEPPLSMYESDCNSAIANGREPPDPPKRRGRRKAAKS